MAPARTASSLILASVLLLAGGRALASELGHWSLDEGSGATAADSSGRGHSGSLLGAPAWVPGTLGAALELDGQSRVVVPDAASLQPAQALSIAAWIRPRALGSQRVLEKARYAAVDGFELSLSASGKLFVRFHHASHGDAWKLLSTSSYPTDGSSWMHVAASFDGSRIELFVDGRREGSLAAPGLVLADNAEPLAIGSGSDGSFGFTGAVDDVHLFDRALGEAQVASLIEHGALPPDADADGVPDASDAFPQDPAESEDFDRDGLGDMADLDDDADGLPDAFELAHGLAPRDPSDAGQDPDADGVSNLEEFRRGSDPWRAPPALLGHWAFDEGSGSAASDSSPLGNHGSLSGLPSWTAGARGSALEFPGQGSRVLVPDHGSLDSPELTLSAWLRPRAAGTQYVVRKGRFGAADGFELSLASDRSVFARVNQKSSGDLYRLSSHTPHPVDGATWIHVVATLGGGELRLYLNGALEGALTTPGLARAGNAAALSFGAQDDGQRPYTGALDDVQLFDQAVTAVQVQNLMLYGSLLADSDGDGVEDVDDLFPADRSEWADADADGTGDHADPDDDEDGLPDAWELGFGLDPFDPADAGADADADGLSSRDELAAGTDPQRADSDGDGRGDGADAFPADASEWTDTDADGTGDQADSDDDQDGLPDAWELRYGFDPLAPSAAGADSDGDGIADLEELRFGTDPRAAPLEVGLWRFDEGAGSLAADSSPFQNHAAIAGQAEWGSGVLGAALDLSRGGQPVVVRDHASLDRTRAITLAAWIQPGAQKTQYLIKKARTHAIDGYELGLTAYGKVFVRFNQASAGPAWRLASESLYPSDGQSWLFAAASFDGQVIRLYLNGALEASRAAPGLSIGANELDLVMGADADGSGPFRGRLDHAAVYGRALLASEIQLLMQQGSPLGDADLDEVPDPEDAFPLDPNESVDTDQDGIGNRADPDDDGDQMPDAWEILHGLDPLDPADADADRDGDGLPNGWEFHFGFDPNDPADAAQDPDQDGASNLAEFERETHPLDRDDDGYLGADDAFPDDPNEWIDWDGDGTGDNADPDDDGDGLPDVWERHFGFDPLDPAEASADPDADGLDNRSELWLGTSPRLADTDADGVSDRDDSFPTDASETSDADGDGFGDHWDPDDDADGLPDTWELRFALDPASAGDAGLDPDADGLSSAEEFRRGTNPAAADSDADGVADALDPAPADASEWLDPDSDGRGNRADADDDGDGMPDDWEQFAGLDPGDASDAARDADGDGASNLAEFGAGTNPLAPPVRFGTAVFGFDEGSGATAQDGSGNGHHAQFSGTPHWTTGVFGSAADLRAGSHLRAADHPDLDLQGALTLAAWVRPGAKATQYLIKKARSGAVDGYELSLSSTGRAFVRFNQKSSGDAFKLLSASSYPSDGSRWIHLAASFDGSRIRLYVGGALDASLAAAGLQLARNDLPLLIGAEDGGGGAYTGRIESVHVYAEALSQSQIQTLLATDRPLVDEDGDGVANSSDAFPRDGREWLDRDADGVGDNADLDDDGDGLPDAWELGVGLDPLDADDAAADADSDGIPNLAEFREGANPLDPAPEPGSPRPDADGDGMPNAWEVHYGLDPFDPEDAHYDADSDGTSNWNEYRGRRIPVRAPAAAVGAWSFEEGSGVVALDDSGLGNHAVLAGAAARIATGSGLALALPGDGSRARVADAPSLDLRGPLTLAAWVRPTREATQHVIAKAQRDAVDGFELSLSATGKAFARFDQASSGDAFKVLSSQSYPSDGRTWVHLAVSFDGELIRFYLDGVLETSRYAPGLAIGANDLELALGAGEGGAEPLAGALDEVRIFAAAASQDDVRRLMEGARELSDVDPWAPPGPPGCSETPPNLTIAFLGDQGLGPTPEKVLQLVRDEGAQALVHGGDFDYGDDPRAWDAMLDRKLGASFPVFAVVGNHDALRYRGNGGYQDVLADRLDRIGIPWTGDLGIQSSLAFKGIQIVSVAPGLFGAGNGYHDLYIRDQLARSDAIWRIAQWHVLMEKMNTGEKGDESGWGVYEQSRRAGAIVATAHEHAYSRTHLMRSFPQQQVASTSDTLRIAPDDPDTTTDEGRSFGFVSGLGGRSVREQLRGGSWWASIYTASQGASSGALFGVFNHEGNPRRARFYFKDIDGHVPDEFIVESSAGADAVSCEP
jgi:hypothetical protein